MTSLMQVCSLARSWRTAVARSGAVFLRDAGHGMLEVGHNSLALFGLLVVGIALFGSIGVALYRELLDKLGAIPGVRGVSMSQPSLLSGSVNQTSIYVQGRVYPVSRDDLDNSINRIVMSPSFFDVSAMSTRRPLAPRSAPRSPIWPPDSP